MTDKESSSSSSTTNPTNQVSQTLSTLSTTIKDTSPTTMPQKISLLIHTLQNSFNTHHPRILDIYATIQYLTNLSSKLSSLEATNKSLGTQLLNCGSESDLQDVRERMRELVIEKRDIDEEMRRLRGVWEEAMRWVEDEGVMHEMKSREGRMKRIWTKCNGVRTVKRQFAGQCNGLDSYLIRDYFELIEYDFMKNYESDLVFETSLMSEKRRDLNTSEGTKQC